MSLLFRLVTTVGLLLLATRDHCHCHDAGNSEPKLVYLRLTGWPLDSNKPFNGSNNNTVIFDPFTWAWAPSSVGRTLLTYPFDYDILSLGSLTIGVETRDEHIPWNALVNSSTELSTLTANQFIRLTLQYLLTTAPDISGSLCHQYEIETDDWYQSYARSLVGYTSPLRIDSIWYRCYGADRTNVCFNILSESQKTDRIGVDVCVQNSAKDLSSGEHDVVYYGLACFAICLYSFPLILKYVSWGQSQNNEDEEKKFRPGQNLYSARSLMSRSFDSYVLRTRVCRCIVYSILVLLLPAVDCAVLFTLKYNELSLRYNNNIDIGNYYNFMFYSTGGIVGWILFYFVGTFVLSMAVSEIFKCEEFKLDLAESFPYLTKAAAKEIVKIGYDLTDTCTKQSTAYALANRFMLPFSPSAWAVTIGSCLSLYDKVLPCNDGSNLIKNILKSVALAILVTFLVLLKFIFCVFVMFASAIPIWALATCRRIKACKGGDLNLSHFKKVLNLVAALAVPFLIIPCYIKPVTITLVLLVDIITFTLCKGFPIHSTKILPGISISIASGAYIAKFWIEFSSEYAAIGKTIVQVSKRIDDTLNNEDINQATGSCSNNEDASQATSVKTLNQKDVVSEYVKRELFLYVVRKRFPVLERFLVFLAKVAVTTSFLTLAISTLVSIEAESSLLSQGGTLLATVLAGLIPHIISYFSTETDQLASLHRAKLVVEGIELYRKDKNKDANESFCSLLQKSRGLSMNKSVSDGNSLVLTNLGQQELIT